MKTKSFFACIALGISTLISPLESREMSSLADITLRVSEMNRLNFNSQAAQDQFVYLLLYGLQGKKDGGYYLEIGAGEPIFINNTYLFEKKLRWQGVSIDISEELSRKWYVERKNTLLTEDATKSNYTKILKPFPKVIDYLSLDVDGYYTDILRKIPFDKHTFKVITIEHDYYRYGDEYRLEEREILQALGYHMLCADVSIAGASFEDWWIHPSAFSKAQFVKLTSLDLHSKDYPQILEALRTSITSQ